MRSVDLDLDYNDMVCDDDDNDEGNDDNYDEAGIPGRSGTVIPAHPWMLLKMKMIPTQF